MTMPDRLAEIRERHQNATPGPWRLHKVEETPRAGAGEILQQPWRIDSDAPEFQVVGTYPIRWMRADPDDADFIAHSRDDVPWLLERLERAEATDAALREAAGRVCILWGQVNDREVTLDDVHDAIGRLGSVLVETREG